MKYRTDMKSRIHNDITVRRQQQAAGYDVQKDARTYPSMVRPITERAKGPRDL